VKVISEKGLLFAIISKPRKSFVVGSHPIVKLAQRDRSHLSDPTVELWFPLAHDIAVTPCFSRGTEKKVEIKEDHHIRHLNQTIFKQSSSIAGRSSALIASLADVR
jgi:hypothetical protein